MAATGVAPVGTSLEIDVAAGTDVVWATTNGFERSPAWNPGIACVRPDGPAAADMTFRWKSGPGTIRSTIPELDQPRHLLPEGGTIGVAARHDWPLEPGPDGTTTVRTKEAWSGVFARLLHGSRQARLERRLDDRLAHLRLAVERVAAADGGGRPPGG